MYPFNGTDEIRRTMSYNCDLLTEHQHNMYQNQSEFQKNVSWGFDELQNVQSVISENISEKGSTTQWK